MADLLVSGGWGILQNGGNPSNKRIILKWGGFYELWGTLGETSFFSYYLYNLQ